MINLANIFHLDKFLKGIQYTVLVEIVLMSILGIIWFIINGTLTSFPLGIFMFGYGGILLTVAGCVGPGRYHKEYSLLVYTPESGSSFSNEITVSGFVLDPTIKEADIVINGQKIGLIVFDEQGFGTQVISRSDIIQDVINSVYFQTENEKSNSTEFSLFEYTDDMTEEEIDQFYKMESSKPLKTLEEAKISYLEKTTKGMGSLAFALGTVAIINFLLEVLF